MTFSTLSFLAQPAFIVPLYAVLALVAVWVVYGRVTSEAHGYTPAKLAFYVAGEGFGIVAAMAVARVAHLGIWPEFWLECASGFSVGWIFFRHPLMQRRTPRYTIWKSARVELAIVIAVMAGVGITVAAIMPRVVGEQPPPTTYAFWGFAALSMFIGYLLAIPMNWLLAGLGWKPIVAQQASEPLAPAKRLTLGSLAALYGMLIWLATGALVAQRTWAEPKDCPLKPERPVTSEELKPYLGAAVVDTHGRQIGEVTAVQPIGAELSLGGAYDLFGFIDVGAKKRVIVRSEALIPGPIPRFGTKWVIAPGLNPRVVRA